MKKKIKIQFVLLLFGICFQNSWSQTTEIYGKIVSEDADVENINVYNSSSKTGAITNADGGFVIAVKLHDVLKISALFFKEITVTINEKMLESKALTVLVNEEINTLDEVVILSHDLSGELLLDVENAIYFEQIPIDFLSIYNLDYEDIRMTKTSNPLVAQGDIYNGLNPLEVLKLFGVRLTKKKKPTYQELQARDTKLILDVTDVYAPEFIHKNFNIPHSQIEAFHAFVEANLLDANLLKKENEVQLLEFLNIQSQLFLKTLDE